MPIARLLALLLPLGLALAGGGASATTWVFQTEGEETPREQRLAVHPDRVDWLDDADRTLWRFSPRQGLAMRDDGGQLVVVSSDVVDRLAVQLGQARALLPRSPAPRPWAAFEAADTWVELGTTGSVAGHVCRRLRVVTAGQAVGEACVADPAALPGGAAVMALLQALDRLDAQLRQRLGLTGEAPWPWHPLVAASRSGGLPLRVAEQLAGERPLGWQLRSPGAVVR